MLLILFIVVLYVYLMFIIKNDINQLEHLIILLMFTAIVFTITGHEQLILCLQHRIDKCLWNQGLQVSLTTDCLYKINKCNIDKKMCIDALLAIQQWIIEDYKSSQCRKWIRWLMNNKHKIIFSS